MKKYTYTMRYDTKKYLTAVKAVMTNAKYFNDTTHQEMQTVMYNKDNKQFVCDGFMLVMWNRHILSLDALPYTPYGIVNQVNTDYFFYDLEKKNTTFKVQENERLVVENLDEYIKLYPTAERKNVLPIYIFGRFIDAKLLKRLIALIGTDFKKYRTNEIWHTPVNIFTEETSSTILPLRLEKDEERNKIKEQTEQFISLIKGKELESV